MARRFTSSQTTPPREETIRITADDYTRLMRLKYRRKNAVVGLLLLTGVFGVYGFSMYQVKQEPLQLDELLTDEQEILNSSQK